MADKGPCTLLRTLSGATHKDVTLTTSISQVIEPNPRRAGIIFCGGVAQRSRYGLTSDFPANAGLIVPANSAPVILTSVDHGELIRRAWFGVSDTAGQVVTILEVYAEGDLS